jgi:2-isopropylmalate synthase
MVVILDTTLREGELQPGVYFTRETRLTIGRALAEINTPRIELPVIYPSRGGRMKDVKDVILEVQENYVNSIAVVHVRALRKDIDLANAYDAKGCAIYMAPTGLHRKDKFRGMEQSEVIERFINALEYMKQCGFTYRRATIEDASRFAVAEEKTEEDTMNFLNELLKAIQRAGATIISIADTSGILPINRCVPFINSICDLVDLPLACHFHNDYGNALGNAIQVAVLPGVEEVQVSIMGLGTRNGITDHYEFVANLEDLYGISTGEKREKLRWLYETFIEATGIPLPLNHPLTPQSFIEKAGTHQSQVIRNPRGYIPTKKLMYDSVGEVRFEAGQLMSKQVIGKLMEEYNTNPNVIVNITNMIAAQSALRKREVSPWEVQKIIYDLSEIELPIEKILRIIKGSDLAYIMLNLKPQVSAQNLLKVVKSWNEVLRIDEVYGDVDVIILSQIKDTDGEPVVDKIRNRFKDILIKTITLPVE